MSLLHSFINILSQEEIERLNNLRLTARETEVFSLIVEHRHKELPEKADLCRMLNMSPQHFDKNCSLILDKVYAEFVPQGGSDLIRFLNRKDLYGHFVHEIRRQEKVLLKNGSAAELEQFYLNVFEWLQSVSYRYYEDDRIAEYGEKYLKAKENAGDGDRLYVEARKLCSRLMVIGAKGGQISRREEIYETLRKHAHALESITHTHALWCHYWGWAGFYTYIDSQPDLMLEYFKKAYALCLENPRDLDDRKRHLTKLKLAEAHYASSDFSGAYRMYGEIFGEYPELMKLDYYHTTKFVQICIILGDYTSAQEKLSERFGAFIAGQKDTMTTMAALSWAKLYLVQNLPDEAKKFIDLGFRLNKKSFYLQYEVELRNLQNSYFFLKGDFDTAEDFAKKNLKYLNSRGFTLENYTYGYFFKILTACIAARYGEKKFPAQLEEQFALYQTGYYAVYGKILRLLRYGTEEEARDIPFRNRIAGREGTANKKAAL